MNDGTIDFKNHHSVDSLAFGHCDFAYRNLGRPSTIQIKQGPGKFEVIIENRPCFSTDKVLMNCLAKYVHHLILWTDHTPF
jgi:mannose-binding lectin 1